MSSNFVNANQHLWFYIWSATVFPSLVKWILCIPPWRIHRTFQFKLHWPYLLFPDLFISLCCYDLPYLKTSLFFPAVLLLPFSFTGKDLLGVTIIDFFLPPIQSILVTELSLWPGPLVKRRVDLDQLFQRNKSLSPSLQSGMAASRPDGWSRGQGARILNCKHATDREDWKWWRSFTLRAYSLVTCFIHQNCTT